MQENTKTNVIFWERRKTAFCLFVKKGNCLPFNALTYPTNRTANSFNWTLVQLGVHARDTLNEDMINSIHP